MPSLFSSASAAASLLVVAQKALAYDGYMCDDTGYHSDGNKYAFYPNTWDDSEDGFTCMGATQDPVAYDVTWQWPDTPETVNAFPHVKFQNTQIPSSIENITSLKIKSTWGIGDAEDSFPVEGIVFNAEEGAQLKCNVGWDMFAADNLEDAQSEKNASLEIMIWLANFGGNWPLGFGDGPLGDPIELGGVTFNLYYGKNEGSNNKDVYSWLASENVTEFDEDIVSLIDYLVENEHVDGSLIMGLLEFGSEAFFSTENVTFSAYNLEATVESDDPDNAAVSIARLSMSLALGIFASTAFLLL